MRKLLWNLSVPAAMLLFGRGTATAQDPAVATQYPAFAQPATPQRTLPPSPPRSPFAVEEKSGAWFICAATFTGVEAAQLADQVVRQLRERRINAYIYNYADEHRRRENQENWNRMHDPKNPDPTFRPRFTRVEGQCAVLIGGFKDMESASKALKTVKKLAPPKVFFQNGEEAADRQLHYAEKTDARTSKVERKTIAAPLLNPFERSFVIRNPLMREKADLSKRVDPLWKKLNSNEPYSLLKCKKNYTILVKCYQGGSEMQSDAKLGEPKGGFLSMFSPRSSGADVMQCVGNQAHALADFLRKYRFEAYVLHTRQGSLVTIGSFEKLEDEELRQMQQKLSTLKLVPDNANPLQSDVFQLLPNPMPMPVPKL